MSKQNKTPKKQIELNSYKFDTASYVKIPALSKKADKILTSAKKEQQPQLSA
jgi:hypothetical protein